jgi:hypothetical protein
MIGKEINDGIDDKERISVDLQPPSDKQSQEMLGCVFRSRAGSPALGLSSRGLASYHGHAVCG